MPDQTLHGVRVLDLSWYAAGPWATKLLADYGAEVVKVERPGSGDPLRRAGPFPADLPDGETSAAFLHFNTNKRGVTANLATSSGRELVLALAREADLIVESFRPGVLDRLGLGIDDLRAVNPDFILVSISSFGQNGPYVGYRATELTAWAMGEVPYVTGHTERSPLKTAGYQASIHAGTNGAIGAMAALWDRDISGEGQHVDVSVFESVVNLIEFSLGLYQCLGLVHRRRRGTVSGFHPAGRQQAADGELFLMFGSRSGEEVAVALDLPGLASPKFATNALRFQHRDEFDAVFLPWLHRTRASEAFRLLQERAKLPIAKVMTLPELFEDEQYRARGYFVDIEHAVAGQLRYAGPPFVLSESPAVYRRPAPRLGEHNEQVYGALGYLPADLRLMRAQGVI